jgi:site-specific recombinase XerD
MSDCRVIFRALPSRSCYRLIDEKSEEITAVNEFLDAVSLRGLSTQTLRTYAYALLSVWRWMRRTAHSIEELTEAHLADYIHHLREDAAERKLPAPRSINLRLLVARSFYRFHTDRDLPRAARTPLQSIPVFVEASRVGMVASRRMGRPSLRVKVSRRLVDPLGRDQVVKLFESFRTSRDLAIAALMLFCGLRSREVLSLRLGDVSFHEEEIRVWGKGDKDRVLPIAPYVRRALSSYLDLERPPTKHDLLFVSLKAPRRGSPMTASGLREIFRYHRKRSGIHKGNPHRLRHTFATDMVREGMSLVVLKRLMGHTSIEMTLRYLNFSAEDVRVEFDRALRRIAERSRDEKPLPGSP